MLSDFGSLTNTAPINGGQATSGADGGTNSNGQSIGSINMGNPNKWLIVVGVGILATLWFTKK